MSEGAHAAEAVLTTAAPGVPDIRLAGLVKRFGDFTAVDHIDLEVQPGHIFAFLGANGSGKSTTIRMLIGLITPSAGRVSLFGRDLATEPSLLRRVGSLVDGGAFYPFLSGRRNLEVLAKTHGGGAERIDALLDQVGLTRKSGRKVKRYSTGMRQRLGVAAALLGDPDIVILDEPVNGLDVAGIQDMRRLIRSLASDHGKTVFLSSHLLSEVQQVCDRVAIIHKGEMVRELTVAGLLDQEATSLRVEAVPIEAAEAALRPHWPVLRDGPALSVSATRAEAPEVARRLIEAKVALFGLTPVQPNLEDVFLTLTREDEADA